MSVIKYVIRKSGGNFTVIPNKVLQHLKDYTALGLYCYIASLPEGWEFHKDHLAKHANIGRDKINKCLKILNDCGLVNVQYTRDQKGRFAQHDMVVDDGSNFKINDIKEECTPFTEKPLTDNQSLDNSTYKSNIINTIEKHKENTKIKILSASTDAQAPPESNLFDQFWKTYPVKKNKVRARKIWERKRYDKIAKLIMADVVNRNLNEVQWRDTQYIPHPATYLTQERWNDEITLPTSRQIQESGLERARRLCMN